MSFAHDVKKEVSVLEYTTEDSKAFLYGYLKLKGEVSIINHGITLKLSSTSLSITRKIVSCLKGAFNLDVEILKISKSKLNNITEYQILINNASTLLIDLGLSSDGYLIDDEVTSKYDDLKDKVITGMFVARGSINDPEKLYYHLEIVCQNLSECNYIINALSEYGLVARHILRHKGIVVYIKKSEDIGDFLKLIGTNQELFNFENARIKKDYNNYINRIINCDMANGVRSQNTIDKQLEAIKIIEEKIGYAKLNSRLVEGILLRTKYPSATLQELSDASEEELGRFIAKSTLSHIFKDIVELAEKY